MKTLINKSWLTSMCDKVREATGETGLISIGDNGAGLCGAIRKIDAGVCEWVWKKYSLNMSPGDGDSFDSIHLVGGTSYRCSSSYSFSANKFSVELYPEVLINQETATVELSGTPITWNNKQIRTGSLDNTDYLIGQSYAGYYFISSNNSKIYQIKSSTKMYLLRGSYRPSGSSSTRYYGALELDGVTEIVVSGSKGDFIEFVVYENSLAYEEGPSAPYYFERVLPDNSVLWQASEYTLQSEQKSTTLNISYLDNTTVELIYTDTLPVFNNTTGAWECPNLRTITGSELRNNYNITTLKELLNGKYVAMSASSVRDDYVYLYLYNNVQSYSTSTIHINCKMIYQSVINVTLVRSSDASKYPDGGWINNIYYEKVS